MQCSFELATGVDLQDSCHRRRSAMARGAYAAQPRVTDARFENLGARIDRAETRDERTTVPGGHGGMAMPNPTTGSCSPPTWGRWARPTHSPAWTRKRPPSSTLAADAAARVAHERSLGQRQLVAGVDNVFDRTHSEHLNLAGNADFGYPADPVRINEPGRTAWVRVDYRY